VVRDGFPLVANSTCARSGVPGTNVDTGCGLRFFENKYFGEIHPRPTALLVKKVVSSMFPLRSRPTSP